MKVQRLLVRPDQTANTDAGNCTAAVTVVAPTTADNCGVASVTNNFNGTADASGTYPIGTTTVVWTVTDNSGKLLRVRWILR